MDNSIRSFSVKRIIAWYFNSNLLLRILVGLFSGAVVGLILGPEVAFLSPLGDILIRLLKMIVMPVVIFTLIVGAASLNATKLGIVGTKAFLLYMLSSAFAVAIGLFIGNIFRPGAGMDLGGDEHADITIKGSISLTDTFINIIPVNPFSAITSSQMLPTIFICLLLGIALGIARESDEKRISQAADNMYSFFECGAELMFIIVGWVLQYAPIGVFALIAVVFGNQGAEAFGPLALVTLAMYCAVGIHLFLVYGGFLTLNSINFRQFIKKAQPALLTSFVTRSSSGTLPVSLEVASQGMGVSKGVSSFSLPLGATINMDGTAIYQGVCAIFIGLAIGAPLSIEQQVTVIITAVLASIGTAGVPGAGAIMLLMVLESVGLQVEPGTVVAAAYAMILGIDALLDMGRTSLNVAGDLTVTCIIAKSENQLDNTYWEHKRRNEIVSGDILDE